METLEAKIKRAVREIPDFPKKGVKFKDITPLLKDAFLVNEIMLEFRRHFHKKVDCIAAAESRGFLFGTILAYEMAVPFVPLRKPGKLPWKTIRQEFELEYGKDAFEVHVDAIEKGEDVLIFDDVLATGGTARAAGQLVQRLGGNVKGYAFIIELDYLRGRERIKEICSDILSIAHYKE